MSGERLFTRPLWFEPFLQDIKKQLGFTIDIGKFASLLRWANNQRWADGDVSFGKLYGVCRVLFLSDHTKEEIFKEIFFTYLANELIFEDSLMQQKTPVADTSAAATNTTAAQTAASSTAQSNNNADTPNFPEPHDEEVEELTPATELKYLNLALPEGGDENIMLATSSTGSRFQLTDNYLPLTRREMVHAWRHLRKREQYVISNVMDVPATVRQIAKQGILINPVYEKDQVNSENLLLILVDRKGSMTPFHKLTDKLVEAAVQDGGHRKALVYYFYNCPVNVVYKNKNLTEPVLLSELYSVIKPDHTNALIISDAGAARGNRNLKRLENTINFLYGKNDDPGLHKSALFVVWMNPMPRHRWINTVAEDIDDMPDTPIFPMMEDAYLNLLNVVEKLMGK